MAARPRRRCRAPCTRARRWRRSPCRGPRTLPRKVQHAYPRPEPGKNSSSEATPTYTRVPCTTADCVIEAAGWESSCRFQTRSPVATRDREEVGAVLRADVQDAVAIAGVVRANRRRKAGVIADAPRPGAWPVRASTLKRLPAQSGTYTNAVRDGRRGRDVAAGREHPLAAPGANVVGTQGASPPPGVACSTGRGRRCASPPAACAARAAAAGKQRPQPGRRPRSASLASREPRLGWRGRRILYRARPACPGPPRGPELASRRPVPPPRRWYSG